MEFLPIKNYSNRIKKDKNNSKRQVEITGKKGIIKKINNGTRKVEKRKTIFNSDIPQKGVERKISNVVKEKDCTPSADVNPVRNNRLFVKLKKRITNVDEVKALDPRILSITLPRKKCSRWCWANFESNEDAMEALKVMRWNSDIIVKKMLSEEKRKIRKEKRLEKVKIKKETKRALRATWM